MIEPGLICRPLLVAGLVLGGSPGLLVARPAATHVAGRDAGGRSPTIQGIAAEIDHTIAEATGIDPAREPRASDETFIRRAYFDTLGRLPTPAEVERFVAGRGPEKRRRLIDALVARPEYAVNWGRYWRDVTTYHTPASGNYLRWEAYGAWWVDQVRRDVPWNQVVTTLVTATGVNDECAPVNYLTANFGNPVELAAQTSRIFLGVQIQCAQCHDAKTEPWKRVQFHELAAFFGRARLVQRRDLANLSPRGTPYEIAARDDGQYVMVDKKDPAHLIPMTPRFLTGESVGLDAPDEVRRATLARLITRPSNPWFARCYINRIWTQLMGQGFYRTVNDLGPGNHPVQQAVLDLVRDRWIAAGESPRWLIRTLLNTAAYQRAVRPARPGAGESAGLAYCPTRLRPEQLFDALKQALDFDEHDRSIPLTAETATPAVRRHTGLRRMIYETFKADPSSPDSEVQMTIPQALLLINSPLVKLRTSAAGPTPLARLLARKLDDRAVIEALYEETLARKPSAEEWQTCRRYLARVPHRAEALEDIYWSLVNSTEFLTKH